MPSVLVVDDDPAILELLTDILGPEGFEVETALSGVAAVLLARSGRFDAILMDIMMPRLNGVEALRTIKSVAPQTPVIMMTAHKGHELEKQARELGAAAVLWKPFDLDELLALLRRVVDIAQKSPGKAAVS